MNIPEIEKLEEQGYFIGRNVFSEERIEKLIRIIDRYIQDEKQRRPYAIRNLLKEVPEMVEVSSWEEVRACVEPVLGKEAKVVRGIYFDKMPGANWKVPWHQDVTIAVREKRETEGYGNWTVKAGVPHVQPPVEVLENMFTLRIHLDDADGNNGALRIIPGSHRMGKFSVEGLAECVNNGKPVTYSIRRGDVMGMRPLLVHASSTCEAPGHRRVIHLEFSAKGLAGDLDWYGG